LVNREIVCRHFFQVMLCSPVAAFHITHIYKRWYNDINDNLQEPYYVATRFSKGHPQYQPADQMCHNVNKLFTPLADLRNERKEVINERKLYGELWGVARDITQKAVRFRQHDVLKKLQDLLTKIQEDILANDSNNDGEEMCSDSNNNNNEDDKENDLLAEVSLQNPKRRKLKGRPKSSKRIKRSEELKPAKRQNQCRNCGEYGHYRPKCSKK
ncbi:21104_t:CDS:1, partial [Cetraspora pellucida]